MSGTIYNTSLNLYFVAQNAFKANNVYDVYSKISRISPLRRGKIAQQAISRIQILSLIKFEQRKTDFL